MSIAHTVFLVGSRLPTAAQLNAAFVKQEVDLQLDPDWNTRTDSGFWPAKFQGHDAGFEWFFGTIEDAELDGEVLEQVTKFDAMISLVTHSSLDEFASAMSAWAVLVSVTGGVGYSDETNEFFDADEAMSAAKDQ